MRRRWTGVVVGLCWVLAVSCGGDTGSNHGGETHWLSECTESSECGDDLGCSCGVCTRPCDADAACGDLGSDAVCRVASSTEFAGECASAEVEQSFCVAEGSLGAGGSGGTAGSAGAPDTGGSGGSGAGSGGSDAPPVDEFDVCEDVPDACDSGGCFTVCGVNVAILDAPEASGFIVDDEPALYGARTLVGNLVIEPRGARWLVSDADDGEPLGALVYPGLSGPLVASDRVFLKDSFGGILRLNLDDVTAPEIDQRWAPAVDRENPEVPEPLAKLRGTSRGELVFEVGHSVSFVDVSGELPQEMACIELMEPGPGDWYALSHVSDTAIVQLTTREEDADRFTYSIYDRDGDGDVVETLEAAWESAGHFWQDRMAIYTAGDTPRVALYQLSSNGVDELAEAEFPEGADVFSSSISRAGLIVFEDTCDEATCAALDMISEAPLAEYAVDQNLLRPEVCSVAATATGDAPDFWLAPRISPNERFPDVPDIECGPTEHVSWRVRASAWSPDGNELALFGTRPDDSPWLRIWEPGSAEAVTLTVGDDGYYDLDALWWTDDVVIGHAGYQCDLWQDWLYLHDVSEPEGVPLRVDLPGPMLSMDVDAGRIWALGMDGAYDCSANQPEPPKTLWFFDVADADAGFGKVALPDGADPEQLHFAAGRVYLIGADRIDVLDAEGEPLELVDDYVSPLRPATAASELGLFVRDTERLRSLAPGEDTLMSETAACSERFPVGADAEFVYLWSRVPGGPHQVTAAELTQVAIDQTGATLGLSVAARLPWGALDPSPAAPVAVSNQGVLAVSTQREMLILR